MEYQWWKNGHSDLIEVTPVLLNIGIDYARWHLFLQHFPALFLGYFDKFSQDAYLRLAITLQMEVEFLGDAEMIVIIIEGFLGNADFLGSLVESVQSAASPSIWGVVVASPLKHSINGLFYSSLLHFLILDHVPVFLGLVLHLGQHLPGRHPRNLQIYLYSAVDDTLHGYPNLPAEREHTQKSMMFPQVVQVKNLAISQRQATVGSIFEGRVEGDVPGVRIDGQVVVHGPQGGLRVQGEDKFEGRVRFRHK